MPRTGLEALGRTRFAGTPVDTLAKSLDASTESACGQSFFSEGALSALASMGPLKTAAKVSDTDQLYDLCTGSSVNLIRYLPPFKELVECGGAVWMVNLEDGTPTAITLAEWQL